jgi:hypothetical protein
MFDLRIEPTIAILSVIVLKDILLMISVGKLDMCGALKAKSTRQCGIQSTEAATIHGFMR